ncbi:MAG: hypothetical protein KIT84_29885 [Labilithrix sp.]|nr:hypothetical protein [Labilithrix sp.]MCW5815275.1 hypothetical protein [Labilithrix sp.]
MANRLRDVVVAQHRRILAVIDRAESAPEPAALRRVERALVAHLDAEEAVIHPVSEPLLETARYGHEAHVVLRFALDRICAAATPNERATRLRVLRDLFVHHTEREEWITLQLLESRLEPAKLGAIARQLEVLFVPALLPKASQTARRKER